MPLQLSRFEVEGLLQTLTGGTQPAHRDTIVFDKEAGWRFEAVSAESEDDSGDDVANPDPSPIVPPSGGSGGGGAFLPMPVAGTVLYSLGGPWQASPFAFDSSYDTGDIIHASAPNVLRGLSIGAADRVLTSDGTVPQWVTSDDVAATFSAGAVAWTAVNKAGSSLGDLATKSASDLTSGNLAYARLPTGGGSWANGGDLTLTGGDLILSAVGTGGSPSINFDRDNTVNTGFNFRTAGVNRWNFRSSVDDAQFQITARDDAGALLQSILVLNRATGGHALFTRPVLFQTATTAASTPRADLPGMTLGGNADHNLQELSSTTNGSSFSIVRGSTTTTNTAQLVFGKVNNTGTTVLAVTAVAVNHIVGRIAFAATDGVDLATVGARQEATVAAGVSASRVPMYLSWWTAPGLADDDLTERMRLGHLGNLALGATAKFFLDGVTFAGDTYLQESAANLLDFYAGNKNVIRGDGATALADGDTSVLINRRAAGAEALQRIKWKDFATLAAGDKVMILAA
jgi:hypothetical protein